MTSVPWLPLVEDEKNDFGNRSPIGPMFTGEAVVVTGRKAPQAVRTTLNCVRPSIVRGPSVTPQYFTTDSTHSYAVTEALKTVSKFFTR